MIVTKQFKQRVVIGSMAILGLAAAIYASPIKTFKPIFILLNAFMLSFALWEYYHMARSKGFQPLVFYAIASSILYLFAASFSVGSVPSIDLSPFILLFSFLAFFLASFKQPSSSLGNLAVTLFGIAYLTIPLTCALRINYFFPSDAAEDGRLWLFFILVTSKINDIGAFFTGKIFGKTKLAPLLSPQKTIEGAVGGVICGILTSLIFANSASSLTTFHMTLIQSIWIGLIISILAQLGDLAESMLKRDACIKDSNQLPGFGGVLDIVDSLVFTLPFMYLLLHLRFVG